MSQLSKPFPRGRCFVQLFPTLRLVSAFYFAFFACVIILFYSSVFVLCCHSWDDSFARESNSLSDYWRAKLSTPVSCDSCRCSYAVFFVFSSYNLLDRVFRFPSPVQQISVYFFPCRAQGMTGICSLFMRISPWAFNFFQPLFFLTCFSTFYTWSGKYPFFNILSHRVPAFPTIFIEFVHYAVFLVLWLQSRSFVSRQFFVS